MIQVGHKGKRITETLFSVNLEDWNDTEQRVKSSHPEHEELNYKILARIRKLKRRINGLKESRRPFNVTDIIESAEALKSIKLIDALIDYGRNNTASLSTQVKYLLIVPDHVKAFDPNVTIREIDFYWMESFMAYLADRPNINSPGTLMVAIVTFFLQPFLPFGYHFVT